MRLFYVKVVLGIRSNAYQYAGYIYDYAISLYFVNARYYMPETGRFTGKDIFRGDGLNRYVYVGSNPMRFVDPSGYCAAEGQLDPVVYLADIREKLLLAGFIGPKVYQRYDLGDKIFTGVTEFSKNFMTDLGYEILKVYGVKVATFQTIYGYVSTVKTIGEILDKQEKSEIIDFFGGDKLEVYRYNEVVQTKEGKMGIQTIIISKSAYVISRRINGSDTVAGLVAPASVTVSKTGVVSETGVEVVIFDFSQEILSQ